MQGIGCLDVGGPKARMGGNRHQELDSDKETVSGGGRCWEEDHGRAEGWGEARGPWFQALRSEQASQGEVTET